MKWLFLVRTSLWLVFNSFLISIYGQSESKYISLHDLLIKAENQYKVHFAFDAESTNVSKAPLNLLQKDLNGFVKALSDLEIAHVIKQNDEHFLVVLTKDSEAGTSPPQKEWKDIRISGIVTDDWNQEPLIGVSVLLMPDRQLFSTDEKGQFIIEYKSQETNQWLEFRYLGYHLNRISLPIVKKFVEIKLIPQIEMLEIITITDVKSQHPSNASNFYSPSLKLTQTDLLTASVFRDPLRSIQQLSGLNGANDLSAGLQIRGGNTEENLILLDQLTLYSVDHFFGVFSNINPFMLDSVEIYKSYFPSNYGGRTSSMVRMKSQPIASKITVKSEIGLLNSNLFVQAPILKNRLEVLFAGRASTTNLGDSDAFANLLHSGNSSALNISRDQKRFVPANPEFRFNDVYLKLNARPLKMWSIGASFFRSVDKVVTNYQNTSVSGNLRVVENFNDTASWINRAYSFSSEFAWSRRFQSRISFSNSSLDDQQKILGVITTSRLDSPRTRNIQDLTLFNNQMNVYHFRFDHEYTAKNSNHQLGFEWNHYDSTLFRNIINRDVIFNVHLRNGNDFNAYYQGKFSFFERLYIGPGIRLSRYDRRNLLDASPRLQIEYRWLKNWKSSVRWGKYYQYLRQVDFEDRFGRPFSFWTQADERAFKVLISDQWELQNMIDWRKWQFVLEFYFKKLNGVAEQVYNVPLTIQDPATSPPSLPRTVIYSGTGQSYGMDFSVFRAFKYYQLNASWSWINSTVRFPQINQGNPYSQALVRPHQLKFSQTFSYKNWSLNLYHIYGSPQPYVDLFLVGDRERNVRSINEVQQVLPMYFRFDLDLNYSYRWNQSALTAGIGILNLEDRRNVKYIQYVFRIPVFNPLSPNQPPEIKIAGSEVNLLRRTLNLYINYSF
ncbi:MAG: TonB-dependent receptor [Saprospiraceae bacterium]|nr:TonB-dependent receptor [Saprospiraceae bacterium]